MVRVADRFGDYGLVGVVMYETQADRYKVDTLLLSCRVLGRGVEHALLAQLGRAGRREGKRSSSCAYRPTDKNLPALEFLESIGSSGTAGRRRRGLFARESGEPRNTTRTNDGAGAGTCATAAAGARSRPRLARRRPPARIATLRIGERCSASREPATTSTTWRRPSRSTGSNETPAVAGRAGVGNTLETALAGHLEQGPGQAANRAERQLLRGGRHVAQGRPGDRHDQEGAETQTCRSSPCSSARRWRCSPPGCGAPAGDARRADAGRRGRAAGSAETQPASRRQAS